MADFSDKVKELLIQEGFYIDNGKDITLAVLVDNRGCFPGIMATGVKGDGLRVIGERANIITLPAHGINANDHDGTIRDLIDGILAGNVFTAAAKLIDGYAVIGGNFGDETSIGKALERANAPILLHATPDSIDRLTIEGRGDSGCGKHSISRYLKDSGHPFTPTYPHAQYVTSDNFIKNLESFIGTCRIVNSLRYQRIGVVGTRPRDFYTMAINERGLLSQHIEVVPTNIIDVVREAKSLKKNDDRVEQAYQRLKNRCDCTGIEDEKVYIQAQFYIAMKDWIQKEHLSAVGIQCWTTIERELGTVPCSVMSMLAEDGTPAVCETDVYGAMSAQALYKAALNPSGLIDLSNNKFSQDDYERLKEHPLVKELERKGYSLEDFYGGFHCGVLPVTMLRKADKSTGERGTIMEEQPIMGPFVPEGTAVGCCTGNVVAGPLTHLRISIDGKGNRNAYIALAEVIETPVDTFGVRAGIAMKGLNDFLDQVTREGYEHHVAVVPGNVVRQVREALSTYLGFNLLMHPQELQAPGYGLK